MRIVRAAAAGDRSDLGTGLSTMRLLDLFCGDGLASWGYWRSGRFSQIVGVDIRDHSKGYAFDFILADALTLDYEFLTEFDFIHASPPCQGYSKITPRWARINHPRLITPVHHMLYATGKPYVIENVEGSGRELRPNLRLYGRDVGLPMTRPRLFHLNTGSAAYLRSCAASQVSDPPGSQVSDPPGSQVSNVIDAHLSSAGDTKVIPHGKASRDDLERGFGLHVIPYHQRIRITRRGIEEGIPPAFTRLIAELMIPNIYRIG